MFTYTSEKITLRPVENSDCSKSLIWRNDPEVRDLALGYRFPVTETMEDLWFKNALSGNDNTKVHFAITDNRDGELIGFIHLYNIDYIARTAYFGIRIGEKSRLCKGNAPEAMHVLFGFAYGQLNLRKINLEVAAFNMRAIAIYQKFGFTTEGNLRQQLFYLGNYYDKLCMGLLRDEYFAKYPEHKH